MRNEIKFRFKSDDLFTIKSKLIENGFFMSYMDRQINNIYFDYFNFSALVENIEGYRDRSKTRIRWYGGFHNIFTEDLFLEQKIKASHLGRKKVIKLKKEPYSDQKDVNFLLESLTRTINDRLHCIMKPTLINQYQRQYFENSLKIRVTLDTEIKYTNPQTFFSKKEENNVMEVKFNRDEDVNLGFLDDLKLVITRNSKYVRGFKSIDLING
ncbi:VTC domain-containing protein [Robiginitalea sp. IMCC43444]|uniref:VTC domain-containing protein n=1 Tax=Robiginitalea sp. IMCC43444 TaxID=3459121 RepID=UPI0040414C10